MCFIVWSTFMVYVYILIMKGKRTRSNLLFGNTFRQHFLNKITDAQRQSELFVHELLDFREHSSILTNGMTLQRSEIDSLIASVCCT